METTDYTSETEDNIPNISKIEELTEDDLKEEKEERNIISKEQVSQILENIGIFSQLDYAMIEYCRLLNRKATQSTKEYLHFQFHSFKKSDCDGENIPFPTAIFTKPVKKEEKIHHYDLLTLTKSKKFEDRKILSFEDYCHFHRRMFNINPSNEEIFYSFKTSLLQNDGLFVNNNAEGEGVMKLVWISKKAIITFVFNEILNEEEKKGPEFFSPFIALDIPLYQYSIEETTIYDLPINYQDISKINI